MNFNNVLIIGAHYDDAELGAGGTAARLAKEGKNVYKITLTDNETKFDVFNIEVSASESKEQSAKACEKLGIKEITDFETERCSELEYSKRVMQKVEEVIFKYDIDTVFIHYSDDCNHDHIESYLICKTAARHCKNIFMYQSNIYIAQNQFAPTVFFDITDFVEDKKDALSEYGEEHNRFNKLFDAVLAKNKVYGYSLKTEYAEGFMPIKMMY